MPHSPLLGHWWAKAWGITFMKLYTHVATRWAGEGGRLSHMAFKDRYLLQGVGHTIRHSSTENDQYALITLTYRIQWS